MMLRRLARMAVCAAVGCVLLCGAAMAAEHDHFPVIPRTKADGAKWRVAYIEGGPFFNYQRTLQATAHGLVRLGWIDEAPLPELEGREDTGYLWEWLSNPYRSRYINFLPDAYYSADWETDLHEKNVAELVERIKTQKDVDLVIAMGTWSGRNLVQYDLKTPVLVMSASNAVEAGIIQSVADSGKDNLQASMDMERFYRQVRLFHMIVGFDRLGVVYEDTEAGRSYAALDDIKRVADEQGFQIVPCVTRLDMSDLDAASDNLIACHKQLADKADAVYMTVNNGMISRDWFPQVLAPLLKAKLPTFSQLGPTEVKRGVLMSIAQAGLDQAGIFEAETMARIFNGATPRKLNQVSEEPPKIAFNLKTAEIIEYDPPVDILMAADELYHDISTDE